MSVSKRSLRELVEWEGKNGPLSELFANSDSSLPIRESIVLAVRTIYRPARTKLRSKDLKDQKVGKSWMRLFIRAQEVYQDYAREQEDLAAMYLAMHNVASASGWLGLAGKKKQNAMNHGIWCLLNRLTWEEDYVFVSTKAFWGLMENSPNFSKTVSLADWQTQVLALEAGRYPDFPGRALALAEKLAQKLDAQSVDTAISLLEKAEACDFGKEDQKKEAADALFQLKLNRVLGAKPTR